MRLKEKYKKEVIPALKEKLSLKSVMAIPKIEKVSINVGFGKTVAGKGAGERKKVEDYILNSLSLLTGQKPSLRKAKKSIAVFKLREGVPIGALCTLRGKRMYEFLEKLIYVVIPRVRDFRGLNQKSITKEGDLTIGFKEYTPFPELKIEKERTLFGLEVTVQTTAKNKEDALELFRLMGFPIK